MKKYILIIFSLIICMGLSNILLGQSTDDYRTKAAGNWTDYNNVWQRYNGTTWVDASAYPIASNANDITISHEIDIDQEFSIDQTTITSSGTLHNSGGDMLTIADGSGTDLNVVGMLEISGGGSLTINGTCDISGTLEVGLLAGTISGSGTITYSGTSNILRYLSNSRTTGMEFPSSNGPYNLTINLNRTYRVLTFNGNKTISGTLTLTKGIINTSSYTLTLGNSTSTLGTLSYNTNSKITGTFIRWIDGTVTNNILFPLGTSSIYAPVTISVSSAFTSGGTISVWMNPNDPGGNTTAPIENGRSIDRYWNEGYWDITSGNGLDIGTGNYSIQLGVNNVTGISSYAELRVMRKASTASGQEWALVGNHSSGAQYYAERTGLTSFSVFGVGGASTDGNNLGGVNPVLLSSFSHIINGNSVLLSWATSLEVNNHGFDIEKQYSKDGSLFTDWQKIGFIIGMGNKQNNTNYSFTDNNILSGTYFYRLKQIDYNGNYKYFYLDEEVLIGVPGKFNLSQNYPNPFNPVTKINFEIPKDVYVTLKVYDISGREVKSLVNDIRTAGYHTVEFNASNLSSGIYFYTLKAGEFSKTLKMTLIK